MWSDLSWGLMMMAVGMGVVFGLLLLLMGLLIVIGRLDRSPGDASAPADPQPTMPADAEPAAVDHPTVRILADGFTEDQVAGIAVAVMTHAEIRRRLAAPETRVHAPGSQLHTSRWLAVGRASENLSPPRK
ncbi:MAG: OadG family transporter subunit [Propioniciclava sp.]